MFVSYKQTSKLSILHAVLLQLHVPFVSPNLNALSSQWACSASVSAYGVCVLCLSLEVLCVRCEEGILIKLFEPILEIADVSIWKQCTALLALMRLLPMPYSQLRTTKQSFLIIWDIEEDNPSPKIWNSRFTLTIKKNIIVRWKYAYKTRVLRFTSRTKDNSCYLSLRHRFWIR